MISGSCQVRSTRITFEKRGARGWLLSPTYVAVRVFAADVLDGGVTEDLGAGAHAGADLVACNLDRECVCG